MGSKEALRDELTRLLGSMASHLKHAGGVVMGLNSVEGTQVGPGQGQGLGGGRVHGSRRGSGGLGRDAGMGEGRFQSHGGVGRGGREVGDD